MPRAPRVQRPGLIHHIVAVCFFAVSLSLISKGSASAAEIHDLVESHAAARLVELLRLHPEAIHATNSDPEGSLPVHLAATNGDTNILKLLLDSGAEANATNKRGE